LERLCSEESYYIIREPKPGLSGLLPQRLGPRSTFATYLFLIMHLPILDASKPSWNQDENATISKRETPNSYLLPSNLPGRMIRYVGF
jgi:hypothetical protein